MLWLLIKFGLLFADGEDFIAGEATIIFPIGEVVACENITIVDDDIMETLEEDFVVILNEVVADSSIVPTIGTNSMVPVTILDDDSKLNLCH